MDVASILPAMLLCLPRLVGIFTFIPFLSPPQLPGAMRNAVAIAIGATIFPEIFHSVSGDALHGHIVLLLVAKEMALGLILGFIISLVFHIPQLIGDFVDNQRGASIASLFNPAIGAQSSNMGLFLSQCFLVWFIAAGGFMLLIDFIYASFELYPVAQAFPTITEESFEILLRGFTSFLKVGFLIASPVIFSMLISEIALGLVSRFAPQLNVFFISMPLKSVIGIFIILLYLGLLLDLVFEHGLPLEVAREFLIESGGAE